LKVSGFRLRSFGFKQARAGFLPRPHGTTLCQQGWQSCSSFHPGDARVDGFNWDLLNDGIGNPKNVRSLLWAHKTPPAMFIGLRTNAEAAVRAGIKFILFTNQPETMSAAMDEYLKSLTPVPSPHLVHGKLSRSAKRGEKLFHAAGCAECHLPGLFTDLQAHDVGTRRTFDGPKDKFYTPTLVEVWRTAPYLHDGSAATLRDVLTTRNAQGEHGEVAGLSPAISANMCYHSEEANKSMTPIKSFFSSGGSRQGCFASGILAILAIIRGPASGMDAAT
jgi:hypothetical protein